MTSIDKKDGTGIVLYGKPIKYEEICPFMKYDDKTIRKIVKKLEDEGYIETRRTPHGKCFFITKAKKIYGVKVSADLPQHGRSLRSEQDDVVGHKQREQEDVVDVNNNVINTIMLHTSASRKLDAEEASKKARVRKELLEWSIQRRGGGKFVNVAKQMKAFQLMSKAGIPLSKLKNRWGELERDKFYKDKGFDWMTVYSSFDKRP